MIKTLLFVAGFKMESCIIAARKTPIKMKYIRILFAAVLFTSAIPVIAQVDSLVPGNSCWAKPTVWGSNFADYTMYRPLDFHVDGYSNSYLASSRSIGNNSVGMARYEYEITKFDSTGAIVWTIQPNAVITYTTLDDFRTAYVTGITTDVNKNVYITGFFSSEKMIFDSIEFNYNAAVNRGFVAKLDSNGTYRWVTILDGLAGYRSGTSIACSGNRLYVGMYGGGTVHTPDGNSNTIGQMAVLVMDVFGSYITNFSYANAPNDTQPIACELTTSSTQTCHYIPTSPAIQRAPSGKIIILGRTSQYITIGTTNYFCPYPSFCNTYCMVLDTATGFQPPFYISYRDRFYDNYELQKIEKKPVFAIDASDNIYYTDHWEEVTTQQGSYETVFLPDGTVLAGTTQAASCILKYNLTGQLLWSSIHSDITFSSIENTASGIYYFGSYRGGLLIRSQNGDSFAYGQNNGIQDLFVAKSDVNGNFQYVSPFGGNNIDIAYFIRKSPCSENFYLTGLQSHFLITFNQQQTIQQTQGNRVFVLKHSPASACLDPVCVIPSGIHEDATTDATHVPALYPVPAGGFIYADKIEQGNYTIRITDVNGRVFASETSYISGPHGISLSGLPAGIYFIHFTGEQQNYTGRFIVAGTD